MNGDHNFIMDAIRTVFGAIDWVLYLVLGWTYEIFFDVSTVEFFSNETIRNFFSRIQLILGVFMVFKISISVLQAIVDPDKISDKNNGFSAYIKRIVICLIMLTILVPRNIPNASTEYEIQINNNGLLFGTLYSLQGRIMRNNTLGKLILGTSNDVIAVSDTGEGQAKNMKDIGREFTVTILKGFVTKNEECNDFSGTSAGKIYDKASTDATNLLMDEINSQCGKKYALYYYPIVGGVVAAIFAFVLIGFSIDIAVRALKIAVLRLIAPIPIISYLDPNQEKKGAFANWVKALTSTYLDLFIRLAIIYFVIFLVKDIRQNGIVIGAETAGIMKVLVYIVICLGLFFFAKQAPKFIQEVLGIQGSMSNIGLASMLGGAAMTAGGIANGWNAAGQEGNNRFLGALRGGAGAFAQGATNGADASIQAIQQGKGLPLGSVWNQNRDLMAQMRTGDKDAHGGILGRLRDRQNYENRELVARGLGIGRNALASADYENKQWENRLAQAKDVVDDKAAKLSAMKGINGGKMAKEEYAKRSGVSAANLDMSYANYSKEYDSTAIALDRATKEYKSVEISAKKAASTLNKIDKTRDAFKVAPRASDIWAESGTYRSPRTVITNDEKIAVDANNQPILDQNGQPGIGENYRGQYQFEYDPKSYEGTIDDTTVASFGGGVTGSGRNNGGGNNNPPPPPPPPPHVGP